MSNVFSMNRSTFCSVCLGLAFCFIGCVFYITFGFHYHLFHMNASQSLPHTVYVTKPFHAPLKRGDYILFNHPLFKAPIIKQILGVEGDVITHNEGALQINDTHLFLSPTRSNGTPLNPLKTAIVPKGYVFVAGTHLHSFDSRYEEFGLIAIDVGRGRVWPVF